MSKLVHPIQRREAVKLGLVGADQPARRAVSPLSRGCAISGITKGQFSKIDLIKAVVEKTGPAHLVLSTWTQGIRDVDNVEFMVEDGDLLSLQLLTDRSFVTRKPQYCDRIREVWGEESIVCTRTHAKFALIRNDRWDVCIRSSMNLNRNRRFEQFDIDESASLCDFFQAHVDEMIALTPHGFDWVGEEIERGFDAARLDDDEFEPEERKKKKKRWRVPGRNV